MKITTYIPTAQLKPFIKDYKIIESQHDTTNQVVPNTSFALAFRLSGQISYINNDRSVDLPNIALSGLRKSVRFIHYKKNSGTLIVSFSEQGLSAFFRQPLYDLFEQTVPLDHYIPPATLALVEERLAEMSNNQLRIACMEEFLISILINRTPDLLVTEAIHKIHSTRGNIRIKELAAALCISQDAFEKRFRKVTGASPKQFSQIIKMNAIVHQPNPASLLDLVFENGYYDQPHFNRDFKLFTGQTPTDFFKSPSFW